MKLSARNTLPGTIRKIDMGAVNAEVTIEVAPGITIVSVITMDAVTNLGLKEGRNAYAVIKASSVMVGARHDARGWAYEFGRLARRRAGYRGSRPGSR
jgi:molybdate transport system regulatory protein